MDRELVVLEEKHDLTEILGCDCWPEIIIQCSQEHNVVVS